MARANQDAANAKLERVDELMAEIDEHNAAIKRKMEQVDRLLAEADELTGEDDE